MSRSRSAFPAACSRLLELHRRLKNGDCEAPNEVAAHLLPLLKRRLRCAFPLASHDLINDAVTDAIVEYLGDSARFQPRLGLGLDRFLYQASWRNAANAIRAENRRRSREGAYAEGHARSRLGAPKVVDRELCISALIVEIPPGERTALDLWLNGERRTEPLAEALGLAGESDSERRREVKRFKDRVLKQLQRRVRGRERRD